ncbi:MAG: hypothetical protein JWP08_4240, partial [Bryobacterales bacterium]|nr:hypothetical protein [Bryobacterales bacterium]
MGIESRGRDPSPGEHIVQLS